MLLEFNILLYFFLAHPNTKLFITHGGLLSTTETTYHGVLILAVPVFADQEMNAARATMDAALEILLNDSKQVLRKVILPSANDDPS